MYSTYLFRNGFIPEETWKRHGNMEAWKHRDMETWKTWKHGDMEKTWNMYLTCLFETGSFPKGHGRDMEKRL